MGECFCLEVSGDFACFTRPEMKVERVSYDVITPSAARAVFEAILWKPAIRWHIRQIEVLQPIRWMNLRRNEVASVVPTGSVKSTMKQGTGQLGLYIEEERQQRASLFLRDVRYRLRADFELLSEDTDNTIIKFAEMFKRRASKGQCFNQPYLGTREFSCDFSLIENGEAPVIAKELLGRRELGWMLYDMDFTDPENPMPRFFQATMNNGVIQVPAWNSEEVRG
ncbi:type I-C CRISPR-associated protein Cas5c [uncultured Thiothrix sp.]|uniref:type I-C CRISPR-associated protein Cas5c n=1 Tax=uncultured Thiothrix sp. TaxID=223185 RepID=UPI0026396C8B|nr:type I-C CRISPR-associated protein Cas5c [uncultured Thiothrix sp.]HMT94290.1 type I-C CRISPR-associated protein Cas5c [Thiolinea sp.]